jgi:hypothetical protein
MIGPMEPRHIDVRDEETAEAPWGPDVRAKPLDTPRWRAALARYYRGRALTARDDGGSVEAVDPISSIGDVDKTGI